MALRRDRASGAERAGDHRNRAARHDAAIQRNGAADEISSTRGASDLAALAVL